MNFDFMDRRSAERFAELLDENTGSRRHHSRGPADEQLAELVAIGSSLSAARPGAGVDPEFRTGLRAMLVATAERDGIGRTAAAAVETETATGTTAGSRLRAGILGRGGRRLRARGAIVVGVAAGAMAVSGISAASENASPGDALYGVKRSTERAQLAMAGSDVNRGQLSLDFARTRLAEAATMRSGDAGFGGVLDDMDADTRKGVKLLTTSAVARRDTKPLATVDDFVVKQRQTLMPVLDRVSPDDRERAMSSLSLLDGVRERTDDLRAGLACSPVTPAGSDTLGPKLRDCTTTTDSPATSRPSGHSGKPNSKPAKDAKVKPGHRAPADAPDASPSPDQPAGGAAVGPDLAPLGGTGPVTGTKSPSQSPAPSQNENDDVLGGLIGGIFGSQ
nr:DUF5667 domain-containing protein [uncultured Actinoplanes sp.]